MKPNWFAAVPISAPWLFDALKDMPPECRGFAPEDVHMTVAFFGAMDPARQAELAPLFARIDHAPFQITLGGLTALPSRKRCSALSLEVTSGRETACGLIAELRDPLLAAVDARPDERPPLPHITIARPIRKYKAPGRRAALAWADQLQPLDITVTLDRIALYTWAEDRRQRQFQIVLEQPFTSAS